MLLSVNTSISACRFILRVDSQRTEVNLGANNIPFHFTVGCAFGNQSLITSYLYKFVMYKCLYNKLTQEYLFLQLIAF